MLLILAIVSGSHFVMAQSLLPPPFGMKWGEQPDKILDWADAKRLDVDIKIPGKRPEIREFRVSSPQGPVPGHKAFALEARDHRGHLYEVTVHSGAPDTPNKQLKADFSQIKKALSAKHGSFVPNKKQEKKEDGFVRSSESYHVEPVSGLLLLLAYTEIHDTLRQKSSARFSLLYRNDNIVPKRR